MRYQLIKSRGAPEYAVWLKDKISGNWHCWGEVNSPDDYPNLLDEINSGKYFNSTHKDSISDYIDIMYLPNNGSRPI